MIKLPSSEYWQKRAERTLLQNEKSVLEYEKDLRKAYDRTLIRIQKEVDAFYNKYATENQIDLATVRQRLNPNQLKDFKEQSKIYLDEINRLGLDPQYKNYLKQLSAKAYISKLEEIQANIRHQIEVLQKDVQTSMEEVLKEGYENAYYKTLFDVQKNAGFGINFTALGNEQLTKAVGAKWLGDNYSSRIWKNKNALVTQLNQIIPQEFVRGRGSRQVAADISDKLNANYKNALRLARTEMNHISSQATLKSYKDSGIISEYEFLATLDGRTSAICRELDGKVFKLSEAKTGINLPPMHPNCRSTTVPYFPEDDISEAVERIARDESGKSYYLAKDITFQQWVNDYASASYAKRNASTKIQFINSVGSSDKFYNVANSKYKEKMLEQANNLTNEQKYALNRYTGFFAQNLNNHLASGQKIMPRYKDLYDFIMGAVNGVNKDNIVTFRGATFKSVGILEDGTSITKDNILDIVGKTVHNKAFMSTSLNKAEMQGRDVELSIKVDSGYEGVQYLKGLSSSKYQYQDELLINHGSKYIVESVSYDKTDKKYKLVVRLTK